MSSKKLLFYSFGTLLVLGGILFVVIGKKSIVQTKSALHTSPTSQKIALTNSTPIVQTSTSPNGQSVEVTFPAGYSGKVTTTYDGHQFNTVSAPLTQEDITTMNNEITQQQAYFKQIFTDQQKLMNDMFNNNFYWNATM